MPQQYRYKYDILCDSTSDFRSWNTNMKLVKKNIFKHQILKSTYLFFINRKEFEVNKMTIRIRKSKKETTQ